MPQSILTVLGALIGAVIGSIGSVVIGKRMERMSENERIRQVLIQQHLFQLQDAAESLWFRIHNLAKRGGRIVMEDEYFEVTTLYAFGRLLAAERLLALEGIYPLLKKHYGVMCDVLQENRIDPKLEGMGFHRYDRLTLAEATIQLGKEQHTRVKTYLEFRQSYEAENSLEKQWLLPAKYSILQAHFLNESSQQLLASLHNISKAVAKITKIKSELP